MADKGSRSSCNSSVKPGTSENGCWESSVVITDIQSMGARSSSTGVRQTKEVEGKMVSKEEVLDDLGETSQDVKELHVLMGKTGIPCLVEEEQRNTCFLKECVYVAPSPIDLLVHVIHLHPTVHTFNCSHCPHSSLITGMIDHLSMHGKTLFQCKYCSYYNSSKLFIREHIKMKHPDSTIAVNKLRVCEDDEGLLDNAFEDAKHKLSKDELALRNAELKKNWQCGLCDFIGTRIKITEHAVNVHGIKDQFKCNLCSLQLPNSSFISGHCSICHPDTVVTLVANFYQIQATLPIEGINVIMPDGQKIFSPENPVFADKKPQLLLPPHLNGGSVEKVNEKETSHDDENGGTAKRYEKSVNTKVNKSEDFEIVKEIINKRKKNDSVATRKAKKVKDNESA